MAALEHRTIMAVASSEPGEGECWGEGKTVATTLQLGKEAGCTLQRVGLEERP